MAEITLEQIVGAVDKAVAPVNGRLDAMDTRIAAIDTINTRMAQLEAGATSNKGELDLAIREVKEVAERAAREATLRGLTNDELLVQGVNPASMARVEGPYRIDAGGRIVPNLSAGLVEFYRDAIGRKIDGYETFVAQKLKREINSMSMFDRDTSQLNSGAGTVGGFIVPPQYRPELQKLLTAYGQARKLFRQIPMETDTLTMPALDGEMDVYQVGENVAPTESKPTLALFTLNAAIWGALTHIPLKLIMQSNPAIVQIVVEAIFRAFAKKEDVLGFTAKKASGAVYGALDTSALSTPVNGLLWTPSSGNTNSRGNANVVLLPSTKTHISDVTFDDLRALIDATPTPALSGAGYFLHRTVMSYLRGLASTKVASWYNPIVERPDGSVTLFGFPVTEIEAMPKYSTTSTVSTPFVAFCNPVYMALGDMQMPSIAQDSSIGFKEGQIWVRGFEIFGFEATVKDGITILQTAAS